VASVWPANADEDVVLSREVVRDVPLAFASILPADQNVHKAAIDKFSAMDSRCNAGKNTVSRTSIGLNDQICVCREAFDMSLGPIPPNVLILRNVANSRLSLAKA
jgi:hypothetical protein